MIRRTILLASLMLGTATAFAQKEEEQTETADLMELHVIASPREEGAMRRQPASVSLVDSRQLEDMHASSLKGVSTLTPNFFMPDYGSRQSSAVYIRGIGSRINSPAIGLYIDDVPVPDKSAFDFGLLDLQRLDILRGPQTTLYGAGTMGGVMKAYTRSPFDFQGTEIGMGLATGDRTRRLTLGRYAKPSERFAWSFGGFYNGGDGFFHNDFTGERLDYTSGGGLHLRFMLLTRRQWMLDMAFGFEVSNEGAYPYYYLGRQDGKAEDHPEQLGRINSNLPGSYDRNTTRTSMNASKKFRNLELRSITSLQHLRDSMQMDQDFLSNDIYKLAQTQRNITLTQDLLLKSRRAGRWQWISGVTASLLHSRAKAPVTFRQEGVQMLDVLINQNANAHMPVVQSGPMTMAFNFNDQLLGDELLFDNQFKTLALQTGAFHQSTFHELFGLQGLSATLGLRLNSDIHQLRYASWYDFTHSYQLSGHLTMPSMERDIAMVPQQEFHVTNGLYSSDRAGQVTGLVGAEPVRDTHLELMPRIALQYEMPDGQGNLYATVSRGYRSGGYNLQNISEVMRSLMTRDMMQDIQGATLPVLQAQPQVPAETWEKVSAILNGMASTPDPDVRQACTYAPEYAWNYELGTHLNLIQGRLSLDASAYLADVRDLQLSQMSETGLGRIMVNAGKSRSAGMELMLKARPTRQLLLQANYGYTHATFREYSDYDAATNSLVDCSGNYVPFMPQHTMNLDASYTLKFRNEERGMPGDASFLPTSLTLGASVSGAGRIYWTEQNDASQDFYVIPGASATLNMHPLIISLWGRNLSNTRFNTFWFTSAQRAYEQHGKPIQAGLDVRFSF